MSLVECVMGHWGTQDRQSGGADKLESDGDMGGPSDICSNNDENFAPPSRCQSAIPSQSIPICNMKRTPSEIQLREDEALADYRDWVFYLRLVNGMSVDARRTINDSFRRCTDQCLANIMRTRNLPVKDESSYAISGDAHNKKEVSKRLFLGPATVLPVSIEDVDVDREEGIFVMDM
ncbi:expressed unknown protein [Seminavis robusta]|uniref:Uncharacterized protein n=1 Tax=Seminavis robusta TaxID=568900 RepID=A0A9N8EU43_9STRA|nr:expressed unknown protein [Seminavis robusta]|eukprot:Sro1882_g303380.1 n/a (177) ;mRNA; f:14647-15177